MTEYEYENTGNHVGNSLSSSTLGSNAVKQKVLKKNKPKKKTIPILQSLDLGCGATHQNSEAARTDFTRFIGRRVVVNSWYAERMKMEPILLFLGKRIVLRTHIHQRTHSSCSSHLLTGSQLIFFCTLKFNGLFFFFLFFLLVTAPTMRNSPLITEAHHGMPFISGSLATSDATATCF